VNIIHKYRHAAAVMLYFDHNCYSVNEVSMTGCPS
jgi:hypothetical protein